MLPSSVYSKDSLDNFTSLTPLAHLFNPRCVARGCLPHFKTFPAMKGFPERVDLSITYSAVYACGETGPEGFSSTARLQDPHSSCTLETHTRRTST